MIDRHTIYIVHQCIQNVKHVKSKSVWMFNRSNETSPSVCSQYICYAYVYSITILTYQLKWTTLVKIETTTTSTTTPTDW